MDVSGGGHRLGESGAPYSEGYHVYYKGRGEVYQTYHSLIVVSS